MFRLVFDMHSRHNQAVTQRKRTAAARLLEQQVKDRIRRGGDEEKKFAPLDYPRPDGTTANPLYHTGKHLYRSIRGVVTRNGIAVVSDFIGAKLHDQGTTGKGGTLPPIVPKRAKFLAFPVFGGGRKQKMMYRQEVNIRPREFFRLTRRNRAELARIFKET